MRFSRAAAAPLFVALSVASGLAAAEPVYGLVTLNPGSAITSPMYLDRFDSATPGAATVFSNSSPLLLLSGVVTGQSLKSIDFRPANGQLYALSTNGTTAAQLYTVNLMTGALTTVGSGFALTSKTNGFASTVSIDFNLVVDRLRIVTGNGGNYRANPNDGTLVAMDTPLSDFSALISGLAYTNNVAGATSTTLYGYSYGNDTLDTIGGPNGSPSPNAGAVFTVGASNVFSSSQSIGLDIDAAGLAFGSIDGTFYSVNLTTGAFTSIGSEAFQLLDFAIQVGPVAKVPEPEALALLGLGAAALAATRRRRATSARA